MAFLEWKNEYSVSVDELDYQHKKLVDVMNKLHEAMKSGQANQALTTIFDELVNYTKVHFVSEERLMRESGYPGYIAHKKEHDELVDKVLKLKTDFDSGARFLSPEIFSFLKDWLTHHILESDKKYTPHLQKAAGV